MPNFRMKIDRNGMVTYRYRCIHHDRSISCEFNMLCEVGQKYQGPFKRLIQKKLEQGFEFKTIEVNGWPHMADFLVRPK